TTYTLNILNAKTQGLYSLDAIRLNKFYSRTFKTENTQAYNGLFLVTITHAHENKAVPVCIKEGSGYQSVPINLFAINGPMDHFILSIGKTARLSAADRAIPMPKLCPNDYANYKVNSNE